MYVGDTQRIIQQDPTQMATPHLACHGHYSVGRQPLVGRSRYRKRYSITPTRIMPGVGFHQCFTPHAQQKKVSAYGSKSPFAQGALTPTVCCKIDYASGSV